MPKTEECVRCGWAGSDPLYIAYHDREWGVPVWDERRMFEFLLLEGVQAGLSWITVLKRREYYREVFDAFDPERIARYGEAKKAALLADAGIIRNRAKVEAAVSNARAWLELREAGIDPVGWLWSFIGGVARQNAWSALSEVPAQTVESLEMSKALKARGFSFVGPTICYAHMQATGMVNDHLIGCFRYREVADLPL